MFPYFQEAHCCPRHLITWCADSVSLIPTREEGSSEPGKRDKWAVDVSLGHSVQNCTFWAFLGRQLSSFHQISKKRHPVVPCGSPACPGSTEAQGAAQSPSLTEKLRSKREWGEVGGWGRGEWLWDGPGFVGDLSRGREARVLRGWGWGWRGEWGDGRPMRAMGWGAGKHHSPCWPCGLPNGTCLTMKLCRNEMVGLEVGFSGSSQMAGAGGRNERLAIGVLVEKRA